MNTSKKITTTRRAFLKRTGILTAGIAAPFILPASARGANEKIQVGYIGCGRRAGQLYALPKDEARIVALADVYRPRIEKLQKRFKGSALYEDYQEMLASDKVDAVVIATPDHWHTKPTIDACNAGKAVYTEKPLTLTVDEGKQIVAAVAKNKTIAQTGSQQRTMVACTEGIQRILDGELGEIKEVHTANLPSPWTRDLGEGPIPEGLNWDAWCGQTEVAPFHDDLFAPRGNGKRYPDGRPYGWISYTPYSGGEMTGWGAHSIDMIHWALGMDNSGPVEVWPEDVEGDELSFIGNTIKGGEDAWPEAAKLACPVVFKYPNGVTVHLDGKGPAGGGAFMGTEGQINISRGVYEMKRKGDAKKTRVDEPKGRRDTYEHLRNWLECIRTGETPNADMVKGHRSASACHIGNIARWCGRKLQWDPVKETFVNDDEANTYLKREQRKGYETG